MVKFFCNKMHIIFLKVYQKIIIIHKISHFQNIRVVHVLNYVAYFYFTSNKDSDVTTLSISIIQRTSQPILIKCL